MLYNILRLLGLCRCYKCNQRIRRNEIAITIGGEIFCLDCGTENDWPEDESGSGWEE